MEFVKILLEQLSSLIHIFFKSRPQLSLEEKLKCIAALRAESEKVTPDSATAEFYGRHLFQKPVPPDWMLIVLKYSNRPITELEMLSNVMSIDTSPDQLVKTTISPKFNDFSQRLSTILQLIGTILLLSSLIGLFFISRFLIYFPHDWRKAYTPTMAILLIIFIGIYLIRIGIYSYRHQKVRTFLLEYALKSGQSGSA